MKYLKRITAVILSIVLCASICTTTTYNAYAAAIPQVVMYGWEAFVAFMAAVGIAVPTVGILDESGAFDKDVLNANEDTLLAEYNASIDALAQARYETGTSPTKEDARESLKNQFSASMGGGSGNQRPSDSDLLKMEVFGLFELERQNGQLTIQKKDWLENMKASEHLKKNGGNISMQKTEKLTKESLLKYMQDNYPEHYVVYNAYSDLIGVKSKLEDFENYPYKFLVANDSHFSMCTSATPLRFSKPAYSHEFGFFSDSPLYTVIFDIPGENQIVRFNYDEDSYYHNGSNIDVDSNYHIIYSNDHWVDVAQEKIYEYPAEFPERQSDEDEWTVFAPQEVPDGESFTIGNQDPKKILETANDVNAKNGSSLAKLQKSIGITTGIRTGSGHQVTNIDGSSESLDDAVKRATDARNEALPKPSQNPSGEDEPDLGDFALPGNLPDITSKFPFCIPFDLVDCFSGLHTDTRKAPVWSFNLNFSSIKYSKEIKVDMSDYDKYIQIFREGVFIVFVVGLILATGKLINWEAAS